jgi:hypothetical protein
MKPLRSLSVCLLTVLTVMAGLTLSHAESGTGLLLPFPSDAPSAPATAQAPDDPDVTRPAGVPSRSESTAPDPGKDRKQDETLRALEIAETFVHRQQMEVSNSVPVRGASASRLPLRAPAPPSSSRAPVIAARNSEPALPADTSGPSSELLPPLPGDDARDQPLESLLPDPSAILPGGDSPPESSPSGDPPSESTVPRTDLAPAPAYGGVESQARRGPVFRVSGADAFKLAHARGFKFTPAGGFGSRDGMHTAAAQFPNVLTSEVHGTRMSQLRPPPAWAVTETSNTFFMFCDANYNAVRLNPGWRIRGIKLEGPNWRWEACPRSGANTASFSIRVHAYKGQDASTAVQLSGLTLEGPEGATDWREAFPSLNGRGLIPAHAAASRAPGSVPTPSREREEDTPPASKALSKNSEPPLPE